ncbi:MAG: T9SS type A sorting domain-containing protein [Reichenbachiella sp.]|uniref:T9SS type A sorting domain-containing protein n=1 Tax=Reichenbachiella sp. TaxID=2184521 RepID=UPI0032639BD6
MKKLLSLIFILSIGWFAQAQNVNIPNANFKAALIVHTPVIDTNDDDEIQIVEAEAFSGTLDVSSKAITDMTGVEAFINISTLNIGLNSNLTSIDVSQNTELIYLYAEQCNLGSIDVTDLPKLERLYLSQNSITSIDVSSNPSLQYFNIYLNGLTSLDLSSNEDLISLRAYSNSITSLTLPAQALNLFSLNVGSNSLTSLDISMFPSLSRLYVFNNSLSSLNANIGSQLFDLNVVSNPSLACVSVHDADNPASSQLTADPGITFENDCDDPSVKFPDSNFEAALLAITPSIDTNANGKIENSEAIAQTGSLDVSNSGILSLVGIDAFVNLSGLNVSNNQIKTLDLSANASLTSVNVSNNAFTVLKVDNGANTSISSFDASSNDDLSCITVDNPTYSQSNWTNIPAGTGFSTDCIVDIPNTAFKTALISHSPDIDLNDDGEVQVSEAFAFTDDLSVGNNSSITDLKGIEAFVNITYLFAGNNDLQSIDVTQNIALDELRLFNNNDLPEVNMSTLSNLEISYITSLSLTAVDVSNNPKLTTLYIGGNDISTVDLSNNPNLTFFSAGNNELTTVDFSNNPDLDEIYLLNNELISLDLSPVTSYSTVNLTNNMNLLCVKVHSIAYATSRVTTNFNTYLSEEECPPAMPDAKLREALLAHDPVIDTDDDGILQLDEITAYNGTLFLGSKLITDLTGLESFENIIGLEVYSNAINQITVNTFTDLEYLNVSALFSGGISELDLSANTALENLNVTASGLSSIDLSSNPNLETLECNYNSWSVLDLSDNPLLTSLSATNNSFVSIDLTSNVNLVTLDLSSNPLTSVNLSQNTALEDLELQMTSLSSVDLSANTALMRLLIADSQGELLTTLDLSQNTALEYVNLRNNGHTSITFGNSPSITELVVSANSLSSVDLSPLTGLLELNVNGNQLTSLDLSNQENLIELNAAANNLAALDLTESPDLLYAYLYENQLASINLSGNPLLEETYLYDNLLTSVDFSNNPQLNSVDIYENQITFLDFSENGLIESVYAYDNDLYGFNMANGNNGIIGDLDLENNPNLICVTVDDVTYATANFTDVDSGVGFSIDCGNYETDILTFVHSAQTAPATIDYDNYTIVLQVEAGTNIGSLTPTVSLSSEATYSPQGVQDFSSVVTYRSTAGDGREQDWDVTVTEALADPTDILLSETSIDENLTSNSVVGDLASEDASFSDSFTYTFTSGAGDDDNALFDINIDELLLIPSADFETKSSYNIRLQTNDGNGGLFEKTLTITINDVNEAPTDIQLSNQSIDESNPVGTLIGILSTEDVDTGDTHTYTVSDGCSVCRTQESSNFTIVGDELRSKVAFDFETTTNYSIDITTTDAGGNTWTDSFSITINDLPASVTAITLDASTVTENEPAATLVGIFSTSGEDLSGSFTYDFVAGEGDDDNGSFSISGDELSAKESFNYELKNSYSILVMTDDGNGHALIQQLTISIEDLSESTDANILTFVLAEQTGEAVINTSTHTVSIEVANGTDLTNLTPEITISAGASITPEGVEDFSSAVTYVITAEEPTSSEEWQVSVTAARSNATDILTFVLTEQTSEATIDATNHTVTIEVTNGTDVTNLVPAITLSTGATMTPEGAQDFSSEVIYTVMAEDGVTTEDWGVSVTQEAQTITSINDPISLWKVYPNPATEWIKIEGAKSGQVQVRLLNIDGKIVLDQKISLADRINVTQLQSGLYMLQAIHDDITTTTKILIHR